MVMCLLRNKEGALQMPPESGNVCLQRLRLQGLEGAAQGRKSSPPAAQSFRCGFDTQGFLTSTRSQSCLKCKKITGCKIP